MDDEYYFEHNFKALKRSFTEVLDPLECFEKLTNQGTQAYCQLLESSEPGVNGRQQSMLLLGHALMITGKGFQVEIKALNANGRNALALIAPKLDSKLVLKASDDCIELSYPDTRMQADESLRLTRKTPLDSVRQAIVGLTDGELELADHLIFAGVAGFEIMDSFEVLPEVPDTEQAFPDFVYLLADSYLMINQQTYRNELRQIVFKGEQLDARLAEARSAMQGIYQNLSLSNNSTEQQLKTEIVKPLDKQQFAKALAEQVQISPDAKCFAEQVELVQSAIAKGRVFQTVISREFTLACPNPLLAYEYLRKQNPSPYQFYCQLGDYTLIGASPESSLRYEAQSRKVHLMPIAGTRGRGKTATGELDHELDARLEVELKLDEKELAEHMMLVDLARNDLARIAQTGTRKVTELMGIYRYSQVMHMVSRVEAKLAEGLDIFDACQACFHMGTLTGAPKVEAMRLIRDIEQRRRGTYGGAVGYFNGRGDMDTAIIIRSALVHNQQATITAGAGVVADSTTDLETLETINKARSVLTAILMANAQLSQEQS